MHRKKYISAVAELDDSKQSRLDCNFFRSDQRKEPVREWRRSLPVEVKKEIGSDIQRAQWQWPVSKPLVDGLGDGLYEVRTKVQRVQYRVLFCIAEGAMVLLHGFVKKARTAPDDLALGRSRQKAVNKVRTKGRRTKEKQP